MNIDIKPEKQHFNYNTNFQSIVLKLNILKYYYSFFNSFIGFTGYFIKYVKMAFK